MRRLAIVALLAGCVAAPEGPQVATISFGNNGSITGPGLTTVVDEGDRVTLQWGGYGGPPNPAPTVVPGAFARVQAVLTAAGPATARAVTQEPACPDYGTDRVEATQPVAGIAQISAGCPDDGLIALISDLSAAVAP